MEISFTKFQKECKDHLQYPKTHKCYCKITKRTCNSYSCPKKGNKGWKRRDEVGGVRYRTS